MANMGYLIELSSIKLNDDNTSELQLFPYGKYDHPVYGEINFTPEKAAEVAQNFSSNVRGTDIDIDYDHKAHDGLAAGWLRKVEVRENGLFGLVEWTKKAAEHIKNKEYKYFSPEFTDEWKHPKTGKVIKNVLFGGGITNRPFLKDILPLNMSELGMPSERPQEGKGMDPKELRKLLGLAEDATDEAVKAALEAKAPEQKTPEQIVAEEKAAKDAKAKEDKTNEPESQLIAATEGLPAEVIQLAESDPKIKALVEHFGAQVTALGTQLSATQGALRLSEVQNTVKELTEGKNALPAVVVEELTKTLSESDPAVANAVVGILEKIKGTGLVALGETAQAGQAGQSGDGKDATKRFSEEVSKIMASDKLSYGDACERVASLQPQLYAEYAEGAYSFRETN